MTGFIVLSVLALALLVVAIVGVAKAVRVSRAARAVPRVQVPATVIGQDTSDLGIQAGSSGGSHPGYHLFVAYPGPSGERLTARLFVHDRPSVTRPRPFDGTVWVAVADPSDVTLTRAGRNERTMAWGTLAAFAFVLASIAGIWGVIQLVPWLIEQSSAP